MNGLLNGLAKVILSVFYVGHSPKAPGTMGSLAAIVFVVFFPNSVIPAMIVSTLLGLLCSYKAEMIYGRKDPGQVVIDEFAGMLITLSFVPLTIINIVIAFVLFRFFDILKPLGIRTLDKMNHATAIMWDDVLAGLYANLIMQGLIRFVLP